MIRRPEDLKVEREGTPVQAKAIREGLAFQRAFEKIDQASAEFGLLMSGEEINRRVSLSLSFWGQWHRGVWIAAAIVAAIGALFVFVVVPALSTLPTGPGAPERLVLRLIGVLVMCVVPVFIICMERRRRQSRWEKITLYHRRQIPDAALLTYHAALRSRLFSEFFVVEPQYRERPSAVRDPWLVGQVADTPDTGWHRTNQNRCYIVLASWQ